VPAPDTCGMNDEAWNKYAKDPNGNYAKAGTCACPRSLWNMCPNGQNSLPPAVTGSHLTIYADVCTGATQNGIEFVPKNLPASCNANNTHIWQFVNTAQPSTVTDTSYRSGSCGGESRDYNRWYVDACSDNPKNPDLHLVPEINNNGMTNAMDQPTPYDAGADPTTKTFYDVLMCGDKIYDAATWQETGVANPQMCRDASNQPRNLQGTYSAISEIPNPAANAALDNAVCGGIKEQNALEYQHNLQGKQTTPDNMSALNSIATQLNCSK
jgi:hypothetical protein